MTATAAQVFGPTTVNPGLTTTGEKTLLTMGTTLPAGGRNVIICVVLPNPTLDAGATGTFRIKKGTTILYETPSAIHININENKNSVYMIAAVDTSPGGSDSYTFTYNITTAAASSGSVHVEGMVIKTDDAVFAGNTSFVSVAAGATSTLISISTGFPAGSKVAVIGASIQGVTSYANWNNSISAGNVRLKRDGTILSSNQFVLRDHSSARPLGVNLAYLDTPATSTQTYSVELYNNYSSSYSAYAWIIAFTIADGAFLDTGSVTLTSGTQVTVGNLSTTLSGDVAVIGLAAAENTSTTGVTAFNADDVVLQLNNSSTGQISNKVGWHLNATGNNRAGILPLFKRDTGVSSPSYQIKMTARASGINGEAKILAFTLAVVVTISVSDSGVGVDTISVTGKPNVSDAGVGVELAGVSGTVLVIDAGVGVETMELSSSIPVADYGAGTEFVATGFQAAFDDSGLGIDTVEMMVREVVDTGFGVELVDMGRDVTDTGMGIDTVTSPLFNQLLDSGTGIDTPEVMIPQFDAGSGFDLVNMSKEVGDSGAGVETIPFIGREILDVGIGTEFAAVAASVISHDFVTGADTVGIISIVQVFDSGSGVDVGEVQLSIYGVVTVGGIVVGTHSIPYRDLVRDGLPIQMQRRAVDDRVFVGGVEVGSVLVEWEDRVADLVPGVRTVRVLGVVRLVD